jgi:alpha-L-arabinofuranosidase
MQKKIGCTGGIMNVNFKNIMLYFIFLTLYLNSCGTIGPAGTAQYNGTSATAETSKAIEASTTGDVSSQNTESKENVITIYSDRELGQINKKVFGNNFKGRDPYINYALPSYPIEDYGSGVWDPTGNKPVEEVMNLAKNAGISIVRYAAGNHWDWKHSIEDSRKHFLYGLNEFLKTTEEIGAEPLITVSPIIGDERDAANLVEYLNAPNDGSNPNGGVDWAAERASNGHPSAYNVKYFEIGNEVYAGNITTPTEYAYKYLLYYMAMKSVDASIKIGAVIAPEIGHAWIKNVNIYETIIKDKIDFGINHRYFSPIASEDEMTNMSGKDIFKMTLSMPTLLYKPILDDLLKHLRETSGKDIPMAITEYNCGYPHKTLGSALLNAEVLKFFMELGNNILMANHWQFSNGLYGMVRSASSYTTHDYQYPIEYIKRPNYYVYEMYNNHFGDLLIDTEVKSDTYDISNYTTYMAKLEKYNHGVNTHVPYLSVNASKSINGDKVFLMVINKNMDEAMNTLIEFKDFVPSIKAYAWILNGSSITAHNEGNRNNVKVVTKEFEINNASFEFTFEPHSLTAIEVISGNADTTAPTLSPETSQDILWPPNHNMVDIVIEANAMDNSGLPVALAASVISNEPEVGLSDEDEGPDWTEPTIDQNNGIVTLQLRAERFTIKKGRVYTVMITGTDYADNSASAEVEIKVAQKKGKK